ncbi:MAG: glycosyltransferase, partial [Acidimicrobiales bacterium]
GEVPVRALSSLEPIIGQERYGELRRVAEVARRELVGKTVWNVSSTAAGGGVAEMLQVLIGYTRDAGVDTRWLVIKGDAEFFAITKRIHNRLHGVAGDGGGLGVSEAAHYTDVNIANAASMLERVRQGDIVLLHDPQTAGMALRLAERGAVVVWRCHVGRETSNEWTDQAWSFLRPHLDPCVAFIFSMRSYIPTWMERSPTWVIPPSIDPFSPKNQEIATDGVMAILRRIGLMEGEGGPPGTYIRRDGTRGLVEQQASVLSVGGYLDPRIPLVIQVSRWDRLKDMTGVMTGFASHVAPHLDAQLALVGPAINEVTDDPEEAEVFDECVSAWHALPEGIRQKVRLVALPMDDIDENAAMVNAVQRHSTVVVQKSLVEGFGLTVAEAMWKGKAVVGSNVGGIAEQIASGSGILLDDPEDLDVFGDVLRRLLEGPETIAELGARAHRYVLDGFIGDKHLMTYARLMGSLVVT